MLDSHLIVKTSPIAQEKNVLTFGSYRVTVLADRLFRIEHDKKKKFCNEATSAVWYRSMPEVEFTCNKGKDFVYIKTVACELYVRKTLSQSFVVINGKKEKLDNSKNLKGTYRTLDQYNGAFHLETKDEVKLGNGVISENGVAVMDDTCSPVLKADGEFYSRESEDYDVYVFAYGKDYKSAIKAYYDICGYVPLIPRFAFGNWWSRYYAYTEDSYLNLLEKFEDKKIPLTVATVDMDWHYSTTLDRDFSITESGKNTTYYGGNDGWTGYSWNKELFPDYKRFLKRVKDKNLKITLNVHPALGIRWFEDCYKEFAEQMGVDPESEQAIKFDMTDPKFVNAYFSVIHNKFEQDGVDFWWIDWQQGTSSKKKGVDPLLLLNHYHYLNSERDGKKGIILSRFYGNGAHRYPLGFSGDTAITWDTLSYLPYFTATASNIGYGWWSHDIGGHYMGEKDDELYLRSVQFGVFSPILRLHCCCDEMMSKEPWNYPNGIGELVAEALRYRHSLVPYIYSKAYENHAFGEMLIKPLYYEYPDEKSAYKFKNEYFFGDLLVCPVTAHSTNGLSEQKIWLPNGRWTDVFTGDVMEGGREVSVYRYLDSIPVFAKEGAVVVRSKDEGNGVDNPKKLLVEVYNGNGEFTLYEDGDNGALETVFKTFEKDGKQYLTIDCAGENVSPADRSLEIEFKNVKVGSATMWINDRKNYLRVGNGGCLKAFIPKFKYNAEYLFEIEYADFSKLRYVKERAYSIISRMQGENAVRNALYDAVKASEDIDGVKEAVQSSKIKPVYKKMILSF